MFCNHFVCTIYQALKCFCTRCKKGFDTDTCRRVGLNGPTYGDGPVLLVFFSCPSLALPLPFPCPSLALALPLYFPFLPSRFLYLYSVSGNKRENMI